MAHPPVPVPQQNHTYFSEDFSLKVQDGCWKEDWIKATGDWERKKMKNDFSYK